MANMILLCICLGVLLCYFVHGMVSLVWFSPRKVEKQFQKQGIRGPPYRLLIGSFKDLVSIYVSTSPPPPPSGSNPNHMVIQHVLPHISTWVQNYGIISKRDIVDDFKTMFMAGTETTLLLTWACLLLGYHTEWQEKAREEVREVLQGRPPTNEILSRLKIVSPYRILIKIYNIRALVFT
ncbi:Cytochrome P450 [Acorus gramineus]|uniref:Cytochrome P450 n=1 Tax=Acorus gramineus TaxID=55184 RepID=A0AAV9BAR9_ACOGR|nr:Cytochrome P450 [Acorus gramineus]